MESTSEPAAGPPSPDMESASEPAAGPPRPDIERASELGALPQSPSTRPRKSWFCSFARQICLVMLALALSIVLWYTVSEQMLLVLFMGTVVVCSVAWAVMHIYRGCTSMGARHTSIEERFPAFAASAHEGSEDLCAICLEAKIDNQLLRKMVCEHDFHKQCFDDWLLHSPSRNQKSEEVHCPLCRTCEVL
mmetsp:Transcript_134386/g.429347  ORF Transcript_134386/g.429347 Transcript_134386/m.429347 type:complete len:191 (+) Transcript_134386:61-633(+)